MPVTDERGNTILSARDMAVLYMPEIPKMEAELDKLKNQNSKLLNQIQEFKSKVSNSDKTPDCIKCANLDKSDFADIMKEREKEIKDKDNQIEMKEKIIGVKEKIIMQKERKISNLQSQLKMTEQTSSESQDESVKLQQKFKAFEDQIYVLEKKNAELIKSIKEDKVKENLQNQLKKTDQKSSELKDESVKLQQKIKAFEEKISALEKKNVELQTSLQAEKKSKYLLEKERNIFKEKKQSFEQEKKFFEKKNAGIFKDISEKNKNLETDFEQERSYFESEISKLTSKLSVLSSEILKEQLARSDLTHKFDTLTSERNILAAKINDLEAANIELSNKVTADVISQSPVDNSTESVCSFKTASSSIHDKNVLKKKSVKPNTIKSSQIRPSNLFYDKSIDGSVSYYVKSLGKQSKKTQMVWRVKDSSEEKKKDKAFKSTSNAKKNSVHKDKSFGNSDIYYSTNHLIRIA
ncbi:hypothetical protein L6452_43487 [Arctium lappa]|uniref:Uncharacterized protein n=1 Tax=Arctium lappa TaxID=4217 RepID=A0ACB8XDI6_ARCLA|nr:hypothetical protein L6452_43487 [Arctium lappa]